MDVARKAVILAREAGLPLELEQIEVESLVPPALANASVDEFLDRLADFDAPMAARVEASARAGTVLRYVAEVGVRGGTARVRPQSFPRSEERRVGREGGARRWLRDANTPTQIE